MIASQLFTSDIPELAVISRHFIALASSYLRRFISAFIRFHRYAFSRHSCHWLPLAGLISRHVIAIALLLMLIIFDATHTLNNS